MARHSRTTPAHLRHQTRFTRTGTLDLTNRKPFRTAAQKIAAHRSAHRDGDGAWRSTAPVSFH